MLDAAADHSFIMTNFVEFDTNFGHRRDPLGYGKLLEEYDAMLPRAFEALKEGELLLLPADHGNDPTWKGTDHAFSLEPIGMRKLVRDLHRAREALGSGMKCPLTAVAVTRAGAPKK